MLSATVPRPSTVPSVAHSSAFVFVVPWSTARINGRTSADVNAAVGVCISATLHIYSRLNGLQEPTNQGTRHVKDFW